MESLQPLLGTSSESHLNKFLRLPEAGQFFYLRSLVSNEEENYVRDIFILL